MSYDASEQDVLARVFAHMLKSTTKDGGVKRAAGLKPPWWSEEEHRPHENAIFSHLNKWKHGEKKDKDSGVHPLVHLAWRALAIAYQETYGAVDPQIHTTCMLFEDKKSAPKVVCPRCGHDDRPIVETPSGLLCLTCIEIKRRLATDSK